MKDYFTPDEIAEAFTGRNMRVLGELTSYYERQMSEANILVRDLQEKLEAQKQRRQMFYEMFLRSGGLPVGIYDPSYAPKEFDESIFQTYQEEIKPAIKAALPAPETVTVAPRRYKRRKSTFNLEPETYAAWYSLIHEEYGVYPPDELGAQYFEVSKATIYRIRLQAQEKGSITQPPTSQASGLWKQAHCTLDKIRVRIGKPEEF